jgi:hypothetical protein
MNENKSDIENQTEIVCVGEVINYIHNNEPVTRFNDDINTTVTYATPFMTISLSEELDTINEEEQEVSTIGENIACCSRIVVMLFIFFTTLVIVYFISKELSNTVNDDGVEQEE